MITLAFLPREIILPQAECAENSGTWIKQNGFFAKRTLMPHREGFVCAGTWSMELVQRIMRYPQAGESAQVFAEQTRPGGSAFEMLSALRRLDADLPLYALGLIGEDENGRTLLAASHKLEIDTFQLQVTDAASTAHANVVHAEDNDSHTRFYLSGANALLGEEHFDFRHCLARWFHLGDCEKLGRLHLSSEKFGPTAGKILHSAHEAKLVTALTLRSQEEFVNVQALLSTLDYLIFAESALDAASLNFKTVGDHFFGHGLHRGLALLGAKRGFAMLRSGEHVELERSPNTNLAQASVSAFSAAFLYGQYSGKGLENCLANALATA